MALKQSKDFPHAHRESVKPDQPREILSCQNSKTATRHNISTETPTQRPNNYNGYGVCIESGLWLKR